MVILISLIQQASTGKKDLWFTFQKTKYIYDAEEKKRFEALEFPVRHPMKEYQAWKGYQEDEEVATAKRTFGDNKWV